jgi:hypothetical protein
MQFKMEPQFIIFMILGVVFVFLGLVYIYPAGIVALLFQAGVYAIITPTGYMVLGSVLILVSGMTLTVVDDVQVLENMVKEGTAYAVLVIALLIFLLFGEGLLYGG